MKKLFTTLWIICTLYVQFSFAQSTANYTRTSIATASLTSMTGSTLLISASKDDFSSELTSIGFNFWFMGVRFNSFSASSNGAIALGNTVISPNNYGNNFPFAGQNIIAPFLQNMETSTTGKVHFINSGTAPNRTITVEFLNMGLNNSSSTADATFQVKLNESTGTIQFIYGAMAIGGTTGATARTAVIGFCSSNIINTLMSVSHSNPFNINTTVTPTIVNYSAAGVIAGLNSSVNGNRVQITFTPPVLIAPLLLVVSLPGINSITLQWTQTTIIGEMGFVILKSDDGGLTYDYTLQTAANATLAVISPLLANKTYLFKIFTLSEGGFSATALAGNGTTLPGVVVTNTATISTQGLTNWSALPWNLGHVPNSNEDVVLIFNRSTGVNDSTSVVLDTDVSINSLIVSNASTTANYKKQAYLTGDKKMEIKGDLIITCPSANKYSRMQYNVTDKTIINGNLIVGTASPNATEGYSTIGSTGESPNQTYIMRGNATFNKRSLTIDEHTIFIFDAIGSQSLINNTGTMATDTFSDAILFENLIIGNGSSPTLTFAGSNFPSNLNDKARAGVSIGANATLILPYNYSLNAEGTGLFFKMAAGSSVKCGGNTSTDSYGAVGSNFTKGYSNYLLDANSTYEYNGFNNITQTIFNGVAYSKLAATNGSASGRASKITTGILTVNTSFIINALADVTLGVLGSSNCAVNCTGPLDVTATGGLYCNANVIAGTGAFTLGNYSYLGLGHTQGISILGSATGNVQLTAARTFNTTGNYIYNGLLSQITGNGLSTTCNDLTIDNPNWVTISTNQVVNGINLLKQGIFDIGSTKITLNGTGILNSTGGFMKANVGIVEMKGNSGTAQGLAGSWFVGRNISTLINANTTGITVAATLNDTLLISSALLYGNVTNSAIAGNDNLTLLSRDSATARFGEIVTGSGNSISGKVNIERYLFAKKSWRLLATPIVSATSPTVTNSWREAAVGTSSTGYGTQLTGPASFVGMDNYTQRASMKYYNAVVNNFVDVTNANTNLIANAKGYFVFVRGDRSVLVAGAAANTILRMKGDILTGNQSVAVDALKFESVGNPYPSRIDFRTITKTNIANSFIAWNPNSAGLYNVGAYETYAFNGTNYVKAGGVVRNFIESGEAFYIQSNTATAGSLVVKESDKGVSSSLQSRSGITIPTLELTLYARNTDSSYYIADGVMVNFDTSYSADFDNNDVRKFLNINDNLSIPVNGYNLFAERRPSLQLTDSIPLSLSGTRIGTYRLQTDPSLLHYNNIQAFIRDNFLKTDTRISLVDTTNLEFEITIEPLSKAANRFILIFKPENFLPAFFTSIDAHKNTNNSNTIEWTTARETNIVDYSIAYSEDGNTFIKVGHMKPRANNNESQYYSFVHDALTVNKMYYKVIANKFNGCAHNTDIVMIINNTAIKGISIFPNPVTNANMTINLNNNAAGLYKLMLSSINGAHLFSTDLNLMYIGSHKTVKLPAAIVPGNYIANIIDEAGINTSIKVTVY